METLRHLQEFITYVDFKADNVKDHKDIYSYIDQKILSQNSPSKDHVPPLDVIIYAIRNILYPTLVLRQIPDLLDLLTTVEFYRNHALSQARDALVWNSYYRQNGEGTITLTPHQEATIEIQTSKNTSLRGIYLKLVFQCCQLDIYNLWTAAEPTSMTDLMIHMNEYFPLLNKNYTQKSPRLFHFDMSDEENQTLRDTGQDCCRFVRDSHAWAVEHKAKDQSLRGICQSTAFIAEFPNPIEEEILVGLLEYYLKYVEKMIHEFGEIFKDNQ